MTAVNQTILPVGNYSDSWTQFQSSRDFLDLREQLTAKDRELVKMREQVALAEAKVEAEAQRAAGLRQANLEVLERLSGLEAELGEAAAVASHLAAARADKELAAGDTILLRAKGSTIEAWRSASRRLVIPRR